MVIPRIRRHIDLHQDETQTACEAADRSGRRTGFTHEESRFPAREVVGNISTISLRYKEKRPTLVA